MIENECLNCMKTVSCKVTTIENKKGYRGHQGALGAYRGCRGLGPFGECQGASGV